MRIKVVFFSETMSETNNGVKTLVIGSESYTYFLPANSADIITYDVLVNTTGPEIMALLQSIRTNA
jgi:hypothetical protein